MSFLVTKKKKEEDEEEEEDEHLILLHTIFFSLNCRYLKTGTVFHTILLAFIVESLIRLYLRIDINADDITK